MDLLKIIQQQLQTNFLGVFGSVTGAIGTGVSLYNLVRNNPKIELIKSEDRFYPNVIIPEKLHDETAKADAYYCVLNLCIKNKHSIPITIGDIQIFLPQKNKWNSIVTANLSNDYGLSTFFVNYNNSNKSEALQLHCYPKLKLPIRLEAYGLSTFQINMSNAYLDSNNIVKLRIHLPTRTLIRYIQLQTLNSYFQENFECTLSE